MEFRPASPADAEHVREWLRKPHVAEFFYGQGLENTLVDLDKWVEGKAPFYAHWIALCDGDPMGYLMTSPVEKSEFLEWREDERDAITLDLLIGEERFLGKGLGVRMIREFLRDRVSNIAWVFIDPSADNPKAIHIYEKAGFKKLGIFEPEWNPTPHWMMRLEMAAIQSEDEG